MQVSKGHNGETLGYVKKRPTGPPSSGPSNIWGNQLPSNLGSSNLPRRATPGSAGLDLRATSRIVLTPQMGVQPIPSDFHGPLPPNTVGLLLGRSSTTLEGLVVHPGVIDQDYEGQLKIMCSSPRGLFSISPGDRIAQLLVLPSCHAQFKSGSTKRGKKGFGSTGTDSAYLMVDLHARPTLILTIEGKTFEGILDTGADKSIISTKWWPTKWPITQSSHSLQGLGYEASPTVSSRPLKWKAPEGQEGSFVPYVLPLPVNLWGRDILAELGLKLMNEYSLPAQRMVRDMGYVPGKGIGKHHQGTTEPIQPTAKLDRHGLGFS